MAENELQQIAKEEGVMLPSQPGSAAASLHQQLSSRFGSTIRPDVHPAHARRAQGRDHRVRRTRLSTASTRQSRAMPKRCFRSFKTTFASRRMLPGRWAWLVDRDSKIPPRRLLRPLHRNSRARRSHYGTSVIDRPSHFRLQSMFSAAVTL